MLVASVRSDVLTVAKGGNSARARQLSPGHTNVAHRPLGKDEMWDMLPCAWTVRTPCSVRNAGHERTNAL